MKKIYNTLVVFAVILFAASCTKSFDAINTDPDNPKEEDVTSTNVLAFCERYASDNLFDEWFDLNESCGFSGQIAKWMYTEEGYYAFRPNVNSSSWNVCYRTISNLQGIIEKEEEGSNMWAVATIFQCQIYQITSDRWGNIPYSEACKLYLDGGITQPKYDKQSDIYPDLLSRLSAAVNALDEDGDDIGNGDVMLNGDIELWKKYGNALRLRIAARIANVASAQAEAVFEEIAAEDIPVDNDDNIFFTAWGNEYAEPWADYYLTRKNEYGISKLMVETLDGLEDPRLPVYAMPTTAYTKGESTVPYVGYQNGQKAQANTAKHSKIGNRFQSKSGLTGFSPWLRSCEVYFAIAYGASKGYNVGMTQQEAYEKAVTLSLEECGVSAADIEAYMAGAGAYDGTAEQLFTQWWISVFKNGQEAWSVYRMSGYPAGNVIAPSSSYPNHNVPPMAYPYPDTEANLNNANYKVEAAAEVDFFWGKKMWWDVRTGIN